MVKYGLLFFSALVLLSMVGCSTLESVISGAEKVGGITGSVGGGAAGSMAESFRLRSDELLCSSRDADTVMGSRFKIAKVLTAASPASKGQAEVLFANGDTKWVKYALETHEARKEELKVGDPILRQTWAHHENMSETEYREGDWYWVNVTSVDDLFKGMLEVNGDAVYLKWLRLPDRPVM